jgi:tRNA dimethylallyltransferase
MPSSEKIIFIVGPTAVGKSSVALSLAKMLKTEIVSCDSMQVYREAAIATNKPSLEELSHIPHHLIDVVSVSEEFDVFRYYTLAIEQIKKILKKKRIPLVVGGSGMYMQILLDGIFEGGKKDDALREKLKKEAQKYGRQFLYDKLQSVDPLAAQKIHAHDERRIVRALEVYFTEEKPISALHAQRQGLFNQYDVRVFVLTQDREKLYQAINHRVDEMFARGLLDEIKTLLGLPLSLTAQSIIGVREIKGFLEGQHTLEKAKELMKMNTRRYAKRQLTWFRRDKRWQWITISSQDTPQSIAQTVLNTIGG